MLTEYCYSINKQEKAAMSDLLAGLAQYLVLRNIGEQRFFELIKRIKGYKGMNNLLKVYQK
jgi:hypothetical protein